ncbi:hypothetical protein BDR07DRAFT_1398281, partial [Suillus spraguei]
MLRTLVEGTPINAYACLLVFILSGQIVVCSGDGPSLASPRLRLFVYSYHGLLLSTFLSSYHAVL